MILTNVKQGTLLGNEVRLYSKKGLIRKTVFESQLSFLGSSMNVWVLTQLLMASRSSSLECQFIKLLP